jgi:hypothetical protein
MVIDDLHIMGIVIRPHKTDAKPVVDPDTPLSFPVAFQSFQAISRRNTKIAQRTRAVEDPQLSFRGPGQMLRELAGMLSFKDLLGLPVLERFDHESIITYCVIFGKRNSLQVDGES